MSEQISTSSTRAALEAFARRLDRFFLSDEQRDAPASQLANVRMGLLLSLSVGIGTLVFLPTQSSGPIAITSGALAILTLSLPVLARRRAGMRWLGDFVCGLIATASFFSMWTSGGGAFGILPFLPVLPMLGLLVSGAVGSLIWSGVALAIAGFGASLIIAGAEPSELYIGSAPAVRYAIAVICVVGMATISQLFEVFWNRTALEVADRAQAELRAREIRNQILLEHASEGVMIVDASARVMFASPAADRLVGVRPGESMGRQLREFSGPEEFARKGHIWADVLQSPEEIIRLELEVSPNFGNAPVDQTRVVKVSAWNRLAHPAVEGVVLLLRDITDLARAEANYEALVEHSLQGIAVICDEQVVYVNQALADLFGVDGNDVLSTSREDGMRWVHEGDRSRVEGAFKDAAQSGLPLRPADAVDTESEMRIKRRDGTWRWLQMRITSATWEGRPAKQVAYADITAQKELHDRQLREREVLSATVADRTRELEASQKRVREQERMAAIGTLAAGIAHQINNPVGAILTSADFAILTVDEPDGDVARIKALEDIRTQAIRCGRIVRSILQFSRSEPTDKWANDVAGVLHTAIDVTKRFAEERGAEISLTLAPGVSDKNIRMNPIELEQVFVNLIRNAIEARPYGTHIQIHAAYSDDQIEVDVRDDGPGVAPEVAHAIFDPFFTTRLREGGTGLGLSVAHGIVVDHGGTMWLEDTLGADGADRRTTEDQSAHDHNDNHNQDLGGAHFRIQLPVTFDD